MEGVDHHRQLFRFLFADARLDSARVRPVRDACRVNGERADVHSPAAHEVAGDVVDDFVGVDVGVVVRGRDRERVVVELAGYEAADDEVAWLEGQVHRRGLVDPAGDRLEVLDVEGKGPQVAVPADQVERVVGVVVGGDAAAGLHLHHEVARLEVGCHLVGWPDVPLAVGRVLEQLAVLIAIAARRLDLRWALEPQHALRLAVRDEPVGGPDRDHEVIAGAIRDGPKDRLQRPAALVHEEHLVGLAVPIEVRHRLSRAYHAKRDVAVGEERDPAAHAIA